VQTNQVDEAGAGKPDTNERRDELSKSNAVRRLQYVEVLQHVWDRHQPKSASEPQTCHIHA